MKLSNIVQARWLDRYPQFVLDPAGLVALADITTVARRTALTGTSSLLDALVICPGMHRQQNAPDLSNGEYPACAAMTTGYVFRVENEATVLHLQKLGKPGHLTTLVVSSVRHESLTLRKLHGLPLVTGTTTLPFLSYSCAVALSLIIGLLLLSLEDWWGLTALGLLMTARLINVIVVRRRATVGWKGALEPGVDGDLLILLSQDRWIRMRGSVDDLKSVTSGQWLREPTFVESSLVSFATLLVYFDAALTGNARREGKLLLLLLLLSSAGLLGLANECTLELRMYDKVLSIAGKPKKYNRRLDLASDLIEQTGRDDWAIRLGMTQPKGNGDSKTSDNGPKTM